MSEQFSVIFCTCPDKSIANTLAKGLVSGQLAACVNILPSITSIYTWQGELESATECMLVIKTSDELYPALEHYIAANHPYELPEIIAVPIRHGELGYLNWISECLNSKN